MSLLASRSIRRVAVYTALVATVACVLIWKSADPLTGSSAFTLGTGAGNGFEEDSRLGLLKLPRMHGGSPPLSQHPLDVLIAQGKQKAAEMEAKLAGIRSLEDAVRDYELAFGMKPPRGFDRWFEFATSHASVNAPSLLSQAHSTVRPYLSLPPGLLHERVHREAEDPSYAFFLRLFDPDNGSGDPDWVADSPGGATGNVSHPKNYNARHWSWTPPAVRKLILPVVHVLPPPLAGDPDTVVIFSIEDQPRKQVDGETLATSRALVDAGKVWDPEELRQSERRGHKVGWKWTCPTGSPFYEAERIDRNGDNVKAYPGRADQADRSGIKSFIYDTIRSFDFCENLLLHGLHALLLVDERPTHDLIPVVTNTRSFTTPDLAWTPPLACDVDVDPIPWANKNDSRLLWRGAPTGMPHNHFLGWRANPRHRAHQLGHNATGNRDVLVVRPNNHWTSYSPLAAKTKVVQETWDVKTLVKKYLDLWMVGKPYFCAEEDGSCDAMRTEINWGPKVSPDEAKLYKYILDIDGHGWSSRLRRELTTGGVLLKSTIVLEWHADILIPWYHYVPVKVDYGDVFDIMAYFAGSPDGLVPGRDDLAEEIAAHGRQFAMQRWREVDMQSFVLLMLLEYQRAWSLDREAASYSPLERMDLDS